MIFIDKCGTNAMGCLKFSKNKGEKQRRVAAAFCGLMVVLLTLAASRAEQPDNRPRLVTAYSSTSFYDVDVKDATAAMTIWSKELGREHGTNVESLFFNNPLVLLTHYQAGEIDFAVLRAEEYLRIVRTPDFTAAVTVVYGGKKTQRYFLLVSSASPYQSLKDLRNKMLAIAKGDSIGTLYLSNLLMKEKFPEIPKYFSTVAEKGTASQTLLSVFFRQADACLINERTYDTATELNPQLKRNLRIIGTSPEFVLGLGLIRNGLDADLKERFKDILLRLGDTPRGKQIIALFKCDRFVLIQPADLESVRKLIQENDQEKIR